MSTVEDRLTQALAARAEQVQPEDLRPPEVPAPKVTWLRHPATYVVAAAACAAVITAPFLVDLGGGTDDPSPTPPSPSQTLPPQEDVGGDWPAELGTSPVDVDGDGTKDKIRVRHEPGKPLVGDRARVEVDLSSTGESVFGIVETLGGYLNVSHAVDLDSDGDRELVLYRERVSSVVVALAEDRLVEVEAPAAPALFTGIIEEPDTGRGYQSTILPDEDVLRSYVTTDTYSGIEPLNLPILYPVRMTAWSMVDGGLIPSDEGVQCIDVVNGPDSGRPVPCPEGFGPDSPPTLFPEQQETAGPGESFDVALGSDTYTVGLEDDGSELVVEVPGGAEKRVALPGGETEVYTTPVDMSGANALALLVAQESGDSTEMKLVILQRGGLVVTVTEGPVPFGNGRLSVDAGRFQTWIGPDGALYTAVMTIDSDEEYDVYRWAQGGTVSMGVTPTLQPLRLGCFAIDLDAPSGDLTPC